jgi:hypothetical protein
MYYDVLGVMVAVWTSTVAQTCEPQPAARSMLIANCDKYFKRVD